MRIALDHDGTYSEDPALWDEFIKLAVQRGHEIVMVTMRYPTEPIEDAPPIEIIYTSRKAKADFYQADVWIDDSPHWIYGDAL